MDSAKVLRVASVVLVIGFVISILMPSARGDDKFQTLYRFTEGQDGGEPHSGVLFDSAGNIYGTTFYAGPNGYGVVYKLTPNADGTWSESILFSPAGLLDLPNSLTFDAAGNLFGTLCCGQLNGGVFLLKPNADGTWTETDLYGFGGGMDGMFPSTGMTFDKAGNLYGATYYGGGTGCGLNFGCGTIYKLSPEANGGWRESVLYRFTGGKDGGSPGNPLLSAISGNLVFDSAGNLYGTTTAGGAYGLGVIFKLTPRANGSWTESVLHSFTGGHDGSQPGSQLVFDSAGILYGTASAGGPANCGMLFKFEKTASRGWKETVLHVFQGQPSCNPVGGLVFDNAGYLYGVTQNSPPACSWKGCGTVFKMMPGSSNSFGVLHTFTGNDDGGTPNGVTLDATGNLFGTTIHGGLGWGVVFEIEK